MHAIVYTYWHIHRIQWLPAPGTPRRPSWRTQVMLGIYSSSQILDSANQQEQVPVTIDDMSNNIVTVKFETEIAYMVVDL